MRTTVRVDRARQSTWRVAKVRTVWRVFPQTNRSGASISLSHRAEPLRHRFGPFNHKTVLSRKEIDKASMPMSGSKVWIVSLLNCHVGKLSQQVFAVGISCSLDSQWKDIILK
jgi:hypothetical protein